MAKIKSLKKIFIEHYKSDEEDQTIDSIRERINSLIDSPDMDNVVVRIPDYISQSNKKILDRTSFKLVEAILKEYEVTGLWICHWYQITGKIGHIATRYRWLCNYVRDISPKTYVTISNPTIKSQDEATRVAVIASSLRQRMSNYGEQAGKLGLYTPKGFMFDVEMYTSYLFAISMWLNDISPSTILGILNMTSGFKSTSSNLRAFFREIKENIVILEGILGTNQILNEARLKLGMDAAIIDSQELTRTNALGQEVVVSSGGAVINTVEGPLHLGEGEVCSMLPIASIRPMTANEQESYWEDVRQRDSDRDSRIVDEW